MRTLLCLFGAPLISLALPVSFEKRSATEFLMRFGDADARIRPSGISYGPVTLRFAGSRAIELCGVGPAAPVTYFQGGSKVAFRQFPRVGTNDLYPGIDAEFYGSRGSLEYDLRLRAGASASRIRISIEGARSIRLDGEGSLEIDTGAGLLKQLRPRVFQSGREIAVRYELTGHEVRLRLRRYHHNAALTVDPVLSWTKPLGGSKFSAVSAIALDPAGNIYAAGATNSVDFPVTTGAQRTSIGGALLEVSNQGRAVQMLEPGTAASVGVVGGSVDGSVLYAFTSDGMQLSNDSGKTWRLTAPLPASATPGQPLTVSAISVDSLDPATALVATSQGLFATSSAGNQWTARDVGLIVGLNGGVSLSWVAYHPRNPNLAFAISPGSPWLFLTTNGGLRWSISEPFSPGEPRPAPSTTNSFAAAALSPDGNTLYVVNANGALVKSTDVGMTWSGLANPPFGLPATIVPDPSNAGRIYVLDGFGPKLSTDGGQTFSTLKPGIPVQHLAVDASGAVYAAAVDSLYVSTDGGATFALVPGVSITGIGSAAGVAAALSTVGTTVFVGSSILSAPFVVKLDPTGSQILYSTFFTGTIAGLVVDAQGEAVIGGQADSGFPAAVPAGPLPAGAYGFAAKLSADGTRLLYARVLTQPARVNAVAVDTAGAAYLTGNTSSPVFPTTPGAFQSTPPGPACSQPTVIQYGVPPFAFVSKFSPDGISLVYSTFLAGSCGSTGQAIVVDGAGNAVVTGATPSTDFPVSSGAYQPAFAGGGFIAKLSVAGDKLLSASYLGGSANAAALDAAGNVYATGYTHGFAGGATPGAFQTAVVDKCNPPVTPGGPYTYAGTGDAFALKLDSTLSTARFLTYLGGSCDDTGNSIALDASGNIWVGGTTFSPDFPGKDLLQIGDFHDYSKIAFLSELTPDASQLLFSTYGDAEAIAVNSSGVYTGGAFGTVAAVSKLDPSASPLVHIDSVVPVAVSFPVVFPVLPALAPGLMIRIAGRNLGPQTQAAAQLDPLGRLPVTLGGATVYFGDIPAPLLSVQAGAIVCFVPFEAPPSAMITVAANGRQSNAVRASVASSAPQVLAVYNSDWTMNSAANPAKTGSTVVLYVSGVGATVPPSLDGEVNSPPLGAPAAPIMVGISNNDGGYTATPTYAGPAPGLIAGIFQINVAVQPPRAGPPGWVYVNVGLQGAAMVFLAP